MVINNTGLAALTLLVAESDPNQKKFDQIDYEYVVIRRAINKLVIKNYTKDHIVQAAIYIYLNIYSIYNQIEQVANLNKPYKSCRAIFLYTLNRPLIINNGNKVTLALILIKY